MKHSEVIHHNEKSTTNETIEENDFFWLKTDRRRLCLETSYQGPYEVIEVNKNKKSTKISINVKHKKASTEKLKLPKIEKNVNGINKQLLQQKKQKNIQRKDF